jgi:putative methyltransferase (TIGR04325 family)
MIPVPVRSGIRGILAPIIGFRVAKSWADATSRSSGYQSPRTIDSLVGSDPVDEPNQVIESHVGSRFQQVASAFLEGVASVQNQSMIRVLDIGGGLGEYFSIFEKMVPSLQLQWTIVETPMVCELAKSTTPIRANLNWIDSLDLTEGHFDITLLSGVIQYVERPYELLNNVIKKADFLILNRCPLTRSQGGVVCIQRPGFFESKGSYPVHMLSETELISYLESRGEILSRWMVPEDVAIVRFRQTVHQGLTYRPNSHVQRQLPTQSQTHIYLDCHQPKLFG